jgi:hypothetical protein
MDILELLIQAQKKQATVLTALYKFMILRGFSYTFLHLPVTSHICQRKINKKETS